MFPSSQQPGAAAYQAAPPSQFTPGEAQPESPFSLAEHLRMEIPEDVKQLSSPGRESYHVHTVDQAYMAKPFEVRNGMSVMDLETPREVYVEPLFKPDQVLDLGEKFLTTEHYMGRRRVDKPELFVRRQVVRDPNTGEFSLGEPILTKQQQEENGKTKLVDDFTYFKTQALRGKGITLRVPEDNDILLLILTDPRCANVHTSYGIDVMQTPAQRYYHIVDPLVQARDAKRREDLELVVHAHQRGLPLEALEPVLFLLELENAAPSSDNPSLQEVTLRNTILDFARNNPTTYSDRVINDPLADENFMVACGRTARIIQYNNGYGYTFVGRDGKMREIGTDAATAARTIEANGPMLQYLSEYSRYGACLARLKGRKLRDLLLAAVPEFARPQQTEEPPSPEAPVSDSELDQAALQRLSLADLLGIQQSLGLAGTSTMADIADEIRKTGQTVAQYLNQLQS